MTQMSLSKLETIVLDELVDMSRQSPATSFWEGWAEALEWVLETIADDKREASKVNVLDTDGAPLGV